MRNDIKAKAILRNNGVQLIKLSGNKKFAPRVSENGVELFQQYGDLVIYTNGIIGKKEIEELLVSNGIECPLYIY